MRIAICAAQVPFVRGGAEIHVDGLRNALHQAGHEADVIKLPFKWYPRTQLLKSALAWRMVDITESDGRPVDLAICTKFPSWAARHPNKIAWVIHQFRQAYDWFGTDLSDLTNTPEDLAFRRRIERIDARGLGECKALFANSRNTANRLQRFNGLEAEPLHVPVQLNGLDPIAFEPLVFTVSRLDRTKRIDILINAFSRINTSGRLIIAGEGPERSKLEVLAEQLGVSDRVSFVGHVLDDQLVDYYNRCRAVYFGPIDEDYGLVTAETFTAGKPVVTIADSGGVLELAEHGLNALVAPSPDPDEIAPLLERLLRDESLARELGATGRSTVAGITWQQVVERLLEAARD